jgi:transposase
MQEALFTVVKLEDFVPANHPLGPIHALVNEALSRLNGLFNMIYADTGRASIAPEKLLRAMLIQVFFSVRSERQLMEQVRYNLLYRWFIGLAIDDDVWDHSTFSKNRDRLLEHAVVESFFTEVMTLADKRQLLSKEHFAVDGTLIQARASHKSFVPKDGSSDDANGGGWGGRNTQGQLEGQAAQQRHAAEGAPSAHSSGVTSNVPVTAPPAPTGSSWWPTKAGSSATTTYSDGTATNGATYYYVASAPARRIYRLIPAVCLACALWRTMTEQASKSQWRLNSCASSSRDGRGSSFASFRASRGSL